MEVMLNDVYTNPESPACFAGVNKVFKEAKKRNKRITMKHVRDFLAKQDAYTLHRDVRRRFKRNMTVTSGIDIDWQADLADMQRLKKENNGFTFILVIVDVLSRFAFAEPIKRKTTEMVAEAFERIMKRSGRRCWLLTTDRGTEFRGHNFQEMLRENDIQHHYATSPDVKCAIAERYIRTLKTRLWRYFTKHKTLNYTKILQKMVTSTNNSVHSTIGCAPSDVNIKNQEQIMQRLYGDEKKTTTKLYKAGDHVRITKEKGKLSKGYQPNFTSEVFVVQKVLKNRFPATYKLTDLTGEVLDGIFYNAELVRVTPLSKLGQQVVEIVKSEQRRKQLWHLAKIKDKTRWIRDSQLI